MEIIKYMYRRPQYLDTNRLEQIDSIAVHHTGNDNSIDTNTDYHMDSNGWAWNGYNYYLVNDEIYEVRGFNFKGAGVKHENHHVISIAVQGNYNTKIPSQNVIDNLQWLCNHLKQKVPSIKEINGHNKWNQTSCPGRYFPIQKIKLNEINFDTVERLEKLEKEVKSLEISLDSLRKNLVRRIRD